MPLSPRKGPQNAKMAVFVKKVHFIKEGLLQSFLVCCVNTVGNKVARHSLAYLSVQKWFMGTGTFPFR